MCRLAAYVGPIIPLEKIVVKPAHSLTAQSQSALEAKLSVNGDGFGIAWYDSQNEPGLYRDILPAWSDENLLNLCRMVHSQLFLAHVRAATQGEVSRLNCHPFTAGPWTFAHNGGIGNFPILRRYLEALLPDELYELRRGTSDSELLFLLLLSTASQHSVQRAFEIVVQTLLRLYRKQEVEPFLRLTCILTDGEKIYAFRYATDNKAPTLYYSKKLANGGACIASEPLDGDHTTWRPVDQNGFIEMSTDGSKTGHLSVDV